MATIADYIEITPGTCGGKPRIAGTRIRVQDIVIMTEQGKSPDEIIAGYPHLTLAGIYAALAYYHDNQAEIDQQIRDDNEFVAEMQAKYGRPNKQKPMNADVDGNSVSP